MIKWMIGDESRDRKESFWWNAVGGALNSGQSAILLMFISHQAKIPITVAGIVTISYAVAILFTSITKYGMRNYQVTDVNNKFSFGDYFYSRLWSAALTILICAVYFVWCLTAGGDTASRMVIMGEIIVLKLIDAMEDVYVGRYQQVGRFSTGAKIMTIRLAVSMALMCLLIVLGVSVYLTLFAGICVSLVIDVWLIHATFFITDSVIGDMVAGRVMELLKKCLPLCIGTTLSIYIGNVPKYMIDAYMDETVQAIFGYIMMPVFVVMLLSAFIYQPFVKELGDIWEKREYALFQKKVLWQCMIVGAMTMVILIGGMAVGLPVLSVIYNADLAVYRLEFFVLLLGGGFYALAYYLNVPITTIRFQKYIAFGYAAAALAALLSGRFFVVRYGMLGASILYLCINVLLSVIYAVVLLLGIRSEKGRERVKID